ncbi:tRNA (adenosine(37)-N6)-threonylcarbamoyltransferase complex transferase subunit TsaD [Candidatus Saccharibacteria bacterium]|nr:tRNA (adenosine(37)-N6)-threonylcarbamoyltransferase complex transferase subunit TsaD [Candidatus Saccharibacteria bacterium]
MIILGIESSCDETAAAIVEDGRILLSNVVQSQVDIHATYGGVVPEIAARSHIEVINPVINQAMAEAKVSWDNIDAIAVANAPGLIGSLLVGCLAAATLAKLHNKPLYPVHHVEGHIYANFITEHATSSSASPLALPSAQPTFPMLALAVSGLHSQLVLFQDHGDYRLLGQTLDDAVGEAFDKVAKILGLPYPGGPAIAALAIHGDAKKYQLPTAKLQNPYDFSFSGLKTAVLRAVQREVGVDHTFPSFELAARLNDVQRADFAASFQSTANETLVEKTVAAYHEFNPASVVIAGGVAADLDLRKRLADSLPIAIEYAPRELCTDNGAMIASLAYFQAQFVSPCKPENLEVYPTYSMKTTAWNTND